MTTARAASIATAALLLAITAVAAWLRLRYLGQVPGNPFYDAAVRTMAVSWHAFLFGALDPSGGVSVDKPPGDLWLQVASVKLLGFTPTALKLPQALAGIASVPLVFDFARRGFGCLAGLAAAAALAVLPVTVLTARSDTMDTFMGFLVLVAAWMVVRAIERRRLGWLLAAGAVVGLAFNVKLFQALLPLPALALLWFVGSHLRPGRRIAAAAAAFLAAVAVGFAWIVPVGLTPQSARPYPIGSTDGSIWNLVFVFNGLDRLHGRPVTTPDTFPPGAKVPAAIVRQQRNATRHLAEMTGPTRLFHRRYAAWIGSELFPAIAAVVAAGALAAVWLVQRRRARAPVPLPRLASALGASLALWVFLGVALFSAMTRFHPRYFEAISPAVAAALGAGLGVLALRAGRIGRVLAALVVLATGIYVMNARVSIGPSAHWELLACVAAAILLTALAVLRAPSQLALALVAAIAVAAVLVVPMATSRRLVQARAFDAERSGAMPPSWPAGINSYLGRHRNGTRYAFGSIAPAKAAPLIAANPQPVLMLTSYRSQPLISVHRLAHLVHAGQVRYFLIGRRCASRLTRRTAACPATARWAIAHSTDVTLQTGIGRHHLLYRITHP
ncbi:MAG TPA: glycosyltransferase family 39 protein [Thermoleophilaceae bacterium]|nr:glycosyltransferase family 39 protein [Thermoleophilaceae bacterium]